MSDEKITDNDLFETATYYVACNECDKVTDDHESGNAAIVEAEEMGFVKHNGEVLCEDCFAVLFAPREIEGV